MALPDYFKFELGTAVVWGEAGATGAATVTNTLSLDALADAGGRMGAAVDLGAAFDQLYLGMLWVETGTAPTAGKTVEAYFAFSHDNTTWPGKVTGSDAAYPATISANKLQLGNPDIILIATADTNTILRQAPVIIRPRGRYIAPVVVNLLGQAFRDEATASNNDSRVILVPLRTLIQDTA
jgi:hypothetical protein